MTTKFDKLRIGLKNDPIDTVKRAFRYSIRLLAFAVETLLLYLYRVLVYPLPSRTKAGLKYALNPRVKLDYSRHPIFLAVDSPLGILRTRACEKEPETVKWIEEFIKPGEVFFDIGSNVGAYSLVASKFLAGEVKVYAFEPSFSTYNQLCHNIILNHCQDSIYPFMLALNDVTGMVGFDFHSLEAGDAEHILVSNGDVLQTKFQPVYRQALFGFRLDDLVSNFDFPQPIHIKLDVDGAELAVLHGASGIIQNTALRSILVEVRKDKYAEEVESLLRSSGFELVSMHDRGNGIIWNYIFARN